MEYKKIYNRYLIYYKQEKIYDTKKNKYLKPGKNHKFYIEQDERKKGSVCYKTLYYQAFNEPYATDDIVDYPGETWKRIIQDKKGEHLISNFGRVKSLYHYKAQILRPGDNGKGYKKVSICGNDLYIHRLVMSVFSQNMIIPNQYEVDHINEDKADNRLSNLQYLTKAENIKKAHQARRSRQ